MHCKQIQMAQHISILLDAITSRPFSDSAYLLRNSFTHKMTDPSLYPPTSGCQELPREIRALLRRTGSGQAARGGSQHQRVLPHQNQAADLPGHLRLRHRPPLLQQRGRPPAQPGPVRRRLVHQRRAARDPPLTAAQLPRPLRHPRHRRLHLPALRPGQLRHVSRAHQTRHPLCRDAHRQGPHRPRPGKRPDDFVWVSLGFGSGSGSRPKPKPKPKNPKKTKYQTQTQTQKPKNFWALKIIYIRFFMLKICLFNDVE